MALLFWQTDKRTDRGAGASGAGKPNGWLVAPTYHRGSRPSSPRPSGPLRFAFQPIFDRKGNRGYSDVAGSGPKRALEGRERQWSLRLSPSLVTSHLRVATSSCAYFLWETLWEPRDG